MLFLRFTVGQILKMRRLLSKNQTSSDTINKKEDSFICRTYCLVLNPAWKKNTYEALNVVKVEGVASLIVDTRSTSRAYTC